MWPFYLHAECFLTFIQNRFHQNFRVNHNFHDNTSLILKNNFIVLSQDVSFQGKMMEYFKLLKCLPLN